MGSIKTAISVDESTYMRAEELARRLKMSRSKLYSLAMDDYLTREYHRELLAQINASCQNAEDLDDQKLKRGARHTHRRMVEGTW